MHRPSVLSESGSAMIEVRGGYSLPTDRERKSSLPSTGIYKQVLDNSKVQGSDKCETPCHNITHDDSERIVLRVHVAQHNKKDTSNTIYMTPGLSSLAITSQLYTKFFGVAHRPRSPQCRAKTPPC